MRPPGWRRLLRLGQGPKRVERDVDEELAFHIEMRVQKLMARGMDEKAAREEALRQFGDYGALRDECLDIGKDRERKTRRASRLQELRQDGRYALRVLRQHPGFAVVVLLSLGLGIGANSAIFTLADALFLRTLPVPNAGQLVIIGDPRFVNSASTGTPRVDVFSYPLYVDVRDGIRTVTGLMATGRTGRLDVVIGDAAPDGEPEHPRGRLVTGNYFALMGAAARIGRTFSEEEDRTLGAAPVAVISHEYWQRRFSGDAGVIGRTLIVNEVSLTIIGVTRPGFTGEVVGRKTDLWIPMMMQAAINANRDWLHDRTTSWLLLMGRLAPGASLEAARSEVNVLALRAIEANLSPEAGGEENRLPSDPVEVRSGSRGLSDIRSRYGESLATLTVAVALVLLVVCANVANLLFARGAARRKEIAVRVALGAGRLRLIRQLLTESLLLALAGALIGLGFAWWGSTALLKLAAGGPTPIPLAIGLDWRILGFTACVTLIAVMLFGLAPALRATRVELATSLRAQARGLTGGLIGTPGRLNVGKMLVALQVAVSLTLLVGTSLLVRSTRRLENVDPGVARDNQLIVTVDAAPTGFSDEQLSALAGELLERIRQLPGVTAASFSENGIFSGTESGMHTGVEGFIARTPEDSTMNYDRVGPGYFHAIGARLLQGRDIDERDDARGRPVAVVNQTFARFYFPNGEAIGKRVVYGDKRFEIVGVAADVRDHTLRGESARRIYFPYAQSHEGPPLVYSFELRSSGDPATLAAPARQAIQEVNASVRVLSVAPLSTLIRQSITHNRMVARVISFFGVLAMALAALGLYGVMMYGTVRRTSEFGLRVALGASARGVRRMVLGEALALVALGTLIGLPLTLGATRLLRSQLFQVTPIDPVSFAIAFALLTASAALAAYLPARRATRIGPMVALRTE